MTGREGVGYDRGWKDKGKHHDGDATRCRAKTFKRAKQSFEAFQAREVEGISIVRSGEWCVRCGRPGPRGLGTISGSVCLVVPAHPSEMWWYRWFEIQTAGQAFHRQEMQQGNSVGSP